MLCSIEDGRWVERWENPTDSLSAHIEKYGINIQEGKEEPINLNAETFQKGLDSALKKRGNNNYRLWQQRKS